MSSCCRSWPRRSRSRFARRTRPAGGPAAFGKRRRYAARPVVTVFSPKGGTGKTVLSTNLAAYLAPKTRQARPADRPRPAVRRRRDHARPRPAADDARARRRLPAGSIRASSPATRRAISRGSTSWRRRCAPRRPSSSPSRRCCSCSRWRARPTTSSSSTPRRSSTGRCSHVLRPTDQLLLLCGLDVPTLKNVRLSLRTLEMLGFPRDAHEPRAQPRHAEGRPDEGGRRRRTRPRGQLRDSERSGRGTRGQPRRGCRHSHESDSEFAQAVALIATRSSRTGVTAADASRRGSPEAALADRLAASSKGGHDEPRRPAPGRSERRGSARLTERIQVEDVDARAAPLLEDAAQGVRHVRPLRRAEDRRPAGVHRRSSGPRCSRGHGVARPAQAGARKPSRGSSTQSGRRSPQIDRERLIEEIAADILGYGPLEPFLADDAVTEVMVNGYDRVYVERDGKIEPTDASVRRRRPSAADHRQDRLAGRPAHRRVARRWWTPGCRTGAASTRSSRRSRSTGRR